MAPRILRLLRGTEWLLDALRSDRTDALAGATAYLEMLAVTTAGQALADGAVAAARSSDSDAGDDVAADRAVLARVFSANRLARVPGMLAAVTAGSADLQRLGSGC